MFCVCTEYKSFVFKDSYCGFRFTLTQTIYTSLESPFFNESNECSLVIVKQSIWKLWYFV